MDFDSKLSPAAVITRLREEFLPNGFNGKDLVTFVSEVKKWNMNYEDYPVPRELKLLELIGKGTSFEKFASDYFVVGNISKINCGENALMNGLQNQYNVYFDSDVYEVAFLDAFSELEVDCKKYFLIGDVFEKDCITFHVIPDFEFSYDDMLSNPQELITRSVATMSVPKF